MEYNIREICSKVDIEECGLVNGKTQSKRYCMLSAIEKYFSMALLFLGLPEKSSKLCSREGCYGSSLEVDGLFLRRCFCKATSARRAYSEAGQVSTAALKAMEARASMFLRR